MSRHALRSATLVAIVATATVSTPVAATFPGSNGRITFQRDDGNGITQIWTGTLAPPSYVISSLMSAPGYQNMSKTGY